MEKNIWGHISLGAFHRSHQASYIHDYNYLGQDKWFIHSTGMLSSDNELIQKMKNQNNQYSLMTRSGTKDELMNIESISETYFLPEEWNKIIEVYSAPETKVVSITVTEKGYYYDSNRKLRVDLEQITSEDLEKCPKNVYSVLLRVLQKRISTDLKLTILSCDNLPENGDLTKKLLFEYLSIHKEKFSPELKGWIKNNVSFPNSMVDRITPVVTQETINLVNKSLSKTDECPVVSESYREWIIENNFLNDFPDLQKVGVKIENEVLPYEVMKVRLLNGSHSALSYISFLLGYTDVDKALADPLVYRFVNEYMIHDVLPTVPKVNGVNLPEYVETLLKRFSNRSISDKVQRLAQDGSEKIKNAILPVLIENLKASRSNKYIYFAIATWIKYLKGTDEKGLKIKIDDSNLSQITTALQKKDFIVEFLSIKDIFNNILEEYPQLSEEVSAIYYEIDVSGVRSSLQKLLK